ncbi:MAG: hypothetical protein L0Z62_49340 [Gemmataceae bacterium]|nr:hypothetical protein [Gemmataceae bacterium]
MQSETPVPADSNGAPKGLPPVAPPSGRFIAQLFLIPMLIIGVGALIILGSSYLVRSSHTAQKFLDSLDSDNAEIRWRGAHDLAQVLKRPESVALASDVTFALDLSERLERAVAELEKLEEETRVKVENAEKEAKGRGSKLTDGERAAFWRKLSNPRHHVLYLVGSLGEFTVPVGASVLGELALKEKGAEIKGLTHRRWLAVWALARLGENFKRRYLGQNPRPEDKLVTAEQKEEVLAQLQKEAEGKGKRAAWAREALLYVEGSGRLALTVPREQAATVTAAAAGGPLLAVPLLAPAPQGVDALLERVAQADNPFLRELVALALNFWDGPRVEPTLLRLARDDGHGTRIEISEAD